MSRLVFVGGSDLEAAIHAFAGAGFAVGEEGGEGGEGDRMIPLAGDASDALKQADSTGAKYDLVHVGADDGAPAGSYARAHHRVAAAELPALARRLRSRDRMLVRCVAFGYKNGLPAGADWVVDARFLDNPYWVEELRPQTGLDPAVRRHVLAQPAAGELLDNLERTMAGLVPAYRAQGRQELTIAFGCTGGRHRSVVLATELARRLGSGGEVEVETEYREL
jgi:P-loop ATPase protein family